MATVVNFIDTTLQAAAARGVNLPTADIQLLPSAPLFKVAPDGSITPESITFTATLIDLEADLTFNATGAPLTSPTARSVTVVGESMAGSSVTVIASATVNGRTYTKPCTITKVQDGSVGSTTYTWIKYADSAAGAGLSDDPTGKAYIGLAYNKPSPIESTIASDYTWSLIKGEDGVPGQPGKDGVQLYTWIKYGDYANGDGMYDLPTANTLYIGIAVNKTTATESINPSDYVWSRFKGDQGVPGPALYTWIKYADSAAGAGLSDDPTGKAYIGFAYNKTTAVESENPADYTWSLNQGGQGVPGQPGNDGQTFYTWIKYADAPDGTGLYDVPNASTTYIGIAVNKVTATESTNKADYTWSKFRGDQGVPGNPGQPGQRGTVDISAGTAGTMWSDSEATAAIAQTGYGVPQMLDVVTLYNQAAGFANTRYWNGSAWIPVSQVINGSLLVKNTVAADKIDTRGLSIKDAAGNTILAAGSALSKDYAAPGTLNSDLTPSISAAQNTANAAAARDVSNLVKNGAFDDGAMGNWNALTVEPKAGANSGAVPGPRQLVTRQHDCIEGNNLFPVTAGEVLYFSGWINTEATNYSGNFGVLVRDSNNNFIQYAKVVTLAPYKGWTYLEGSVAIFGNAATAQPWIVQDGDDFSTGNWLRVAALWIGRHARGATVGAPSGTMVGDTEAGLVASRAMNGDSAYNALPGINQQIADKLSKNSASSLAARVTLQTGGAILAGTSTDGSYHDATGFYGVRGGVVKFSVPTTGDPTFGGQLTAAYGTFGALRIATGGNITSGAYTSFASPAAGGGIGWCISLEGFTTGNYNDGRFFTAYSNGDFECAGLKSINKQVTVTNPIIIAPKLQTTLSVDIPLQQLRNVGGSSVTWGFSPVVSGGSGAVARYLWSFTARDGASPITMVSSPSDSSVTLRATGAGWKYGYISLTIYDTNGAVASTSQEVSVQFGSAVEP